MLRVGLTGGLGSGKSTVGAMLRGLGAAVVEADEMGRRLMEPGEEVYSAIVRVFGQGVVGPDRRLNRARLAQEAFAGGRLQELNAIVHPAVIEQQRRWMGEIFAADPAAVAVVVSALIFEVERDARARGESDTVLADWRRRMDRVVLVTAPEATRIARYVDRLNLPPGRRAAAEADARSRMAHQMPDAAKAARADYLLENDGDKDELRGRVETLWDELRRESNKPSATGSLE
jgi:dephospho-CoA kinase